MTFFLTFIFMILVYWRPQEWLLTWMFGIPVLNYIFGLSLLTLMVEVDTGRLRFPRTLPQIRLIALLFLAFPLSHIAHTYFAGFTDSLVEPFKYAVFMILLITVLDSTGKLRALAWLFVAMAAVMSIHMILQEARGTGFAGQVPLQIRASEFREAYTRSIFFGIFEDPNDAGQFVVSAIPFAFLLFRRKSVLTFLLGCGLTFFFLRALGTTHSRGAQVGLVALAGMLVVMRLPQRWMPVLIPLGLIGTLLILPFAGAGLDQSARERVVLWGFANSHLIRNPVSLIFGIGYQMGWMIGATYGSPGETIRGMTFHNAFVHCYTELGYIGFIFWFGLILSGLMGCWLVRKGLLAYRRDRTDLAYIWRFAGGAICSMMAFCASGYFLSRAFIYPLFFMMATLAAVPIIAKEELLSAGDIDAEDFPASFMELPKNFWIFYPLAGGMGIVYVWLSCIMLNLGV